MRRKKISMALLFVYLVGFCQLGWEELASAQSASQKQQRPNIVFILTDQQRFDALGCVTPVVQTPNLDRLAEQGARFSSAYSSVPSCKAARSTLLTGLSPWNHGAIGYSGPAEKYPREIVSMLHQAGYYCMGIGKMHFTPQQNLHGYDQILYDESGRDGQDGGPESKGFVSDYRKWFRQQAPNSNPDSTGIGWNDHRQKYYALPTRLHPTAWTGDCAVDFIDSWKGDQPFFLKVSFARPHSPYDAPEEFCRYYEDNQKRIPAPVVGQWAQSNAERGKSHPNDLWRGDLGAQAPLEAKIGYYANTTFIDQQVGRIIQSLEKRGLMENTFILMTSDHGDMLGDHYLWRKSYAYQGSTHIPMIIKWGNKTGVTVPKHQVISNPVELRDVGVTFLSVAGVDYNPDWFDGRNLMTLLENNEASWREYLDLEHSVCYARENHWSALTDGKMKYIFNAYNGTEQLFNIQDDPGELINLSEDADYSSQLKLWRQRLTDFLAVRGEDFVNQGKLVFPRKSNPYGKNFPK